MAEWRSTPVVVLARAVARFFLSQGPDQFLFEVGKVPGVLKNGGAAWLDQAATAGISTSGAACVTMAAARTDEIVASRERELLARYTGISA